MGVSVIEISFGVIAVGLVILFAELLFRTFLHLMEKAIYLK